MQPVCHVVSGIVLPWQCTVGRYWLFYSINFPATVLSSSLVVLIGLRGFFPVYLMELIFIVLWWWFVGTRLDCGLLGKTPFQHPRVVGGIFALITILFVIPQIILVYLAATGPLPMPTIGEAIKELTIDFPLVWIAAWMWILTGACGWIALKLLKGERADQS
jgi:hypothetical protein